MLTVDIISMHDRVPVIQTFDNAADEPVCSLGSRVDGDELERVVRIIGRLCAGHGSARLNGEKLLPYPVDRGQIRLDEASISQMR